MKMRSRSVTYSIPLQSESDSEAQDKVIELAGLLDTDSLKVEEPHTTEPIVIPGQLYELMDKEFKCPICLNFFSAPPKWLPC